MPLPGIERNGYRWLVPNLPLRAAVASGPDSSLTAQQVFCDRGTEIAAFDASLDTLTAHLDHLGITCVTDRSIPRTNILTYYGVGGIGKSTLSRELARRFAAPHGKRDHHRALAHFDFSEAASFDIESYMLRLRAAVGHLKRSWPAFDIAFAVYWARAHPGQPLGQFLSQDSILRRAAGAVGLADQVTSALAGLLGMAFPGVSQVAHALGTSAWRKARDEVTRHHTLKRCDLLGALLEADADFDSLSYFPYLIAWELARLQRQPRLSVFWDTFEQVTALPTRQAECWLQRSAFLMPNVLFVVTSRNRLDWADAVIPPGLDFTGHGRWPNLLAGQSAAEPRQHLVGFMAAEDAQTYLASA